MQKTREIMRLHLEAGLGLRAIARSLGISHSTVKDHLMRAEAAGLSWPLPEEYNDRVLEQLLFPRKSNTSRSGPKPDFNHIHKELSRKGVTLHLLWQEYKRENLDGYQYSHFCELYHKWRQDLDISMRRIHKAGEKLFVDWAGQTIPVVDRKTGETRPAYLFVAVLGASNYTYAEANMSMDLSSWINAHCRTFAFLGGVPHIIVPDNTKTAVIKPNYYEPDINATYQEMAAHYGTVIIPARPQKPRDKNKVETGVQIAERWILAPLRNRVFFSITELNRVIWSILVQVNAKPFQKLEGSRKSFFESMDQPALLALPDVPYEFALWKKLRVNIDYHVEVDHSYYSVPYQLVRKQVDVRITSTTIEVFHHGERVSSHIRRQGRGRFSTETSHMAPKHRKYLEWTPEKIISWAATIGKASKELVVGIFASRPHPEQGYRSCLGLMRLARTYGNERMEKACQRGLAIGAFSYKSIASILEKGLDRISVDEASDTGIRHSNIRGPEYYRKENS